MDGCWCKYRSGELESAHIIIAVLFIHLTEPRTNYVVQVLAYNEAGEGESAQQQTFTEEDITPALDSELMAPLEVKVRVISPTSVMVTWYDSTLGQNQKNQDDRIYTVKYNALSGRWYKLC